MKNLSNTENVFLACLGTASELSTQHSSDWHFFAFFSFATVTTTISGIEPSYELESVRKKERIGQKLEFMM